MYPGHFAAGLLLKTVEPRASSWGLMVGIGIGIGLQDWLFAVFLHFNVEGGNRAHIDCTWSHSPLASLLWAGLFAAIYRAQGRRVVAVMFAAVMSHWLQDVLSHHPDISLWPHSRIELGLPAGWRLASRQPFASCMRWRPKAITVSGVIGRPPSC